MQKSAGRYSMILCVCGLLAACSRAGLPVDPPGTAAAGSLSVPTQATLLASTPSEISLEPASLSGTIVYSHEGDIYVMEAGGSTPRRLTNDPAMEFDPAWSPDGEQIVFRSHRTGNEEVFRMAADGSAQQNLTNAPGGDYSPVWSPDGNWIAFMSDRSGGNPNVWVMRPDGSDARQVTEISGISEYPSWSPDSRRIAFHCTMGRTLPGGTGDFEICVVNVDGSQLIQLTDAPGESKLPAWSPDGEQIAFQSNREGWPTLPEQPPGYDPERYGDYEIYIMGADGSGQVNLTRHPQADDSFPAWSKDGRLIFSRYGCLLVMDRRGEAVEQLSAGSCAGEDSGEFPDWFQPAAAE